MCESQWCSPYRWLRRSLACAVILGLAFGCRAFEPEEQPPRIRPERPIWDVVELRRHLQFFNGESVRGRATATQGYAQAAGYVAARLGEFGLQPLYANEFRVIYPTAVHYPVGASLYAFGADTLQYINGIDFIPEGRSATGAAAVRQVVADPMGERADLANRETAMVVSPHHASDAYLKAVQQGGGRLVLIAEELDPRLALQPLNDLLVMQAPSARIAHWVGQSPERFERLWQRQELRGWTLQRTLHAQVTTSYESAAGAINMIGFVSGKHPVHKHDLIIVCADLDAIGPFAGLRVRDTEHFGMGTAALLEVMRNMGHISRFYNVPERSVLVAVWSGARQGHRGMQAFLRVPPWPLDRVAAVVYVGNEPKEEPAMRALWDAEGIPLYTVPVRRDSLLQPRQYVLPEPAAVRLATARTDSVTQIGVPDLPLLVENALRPTTAMTEQAFRYLIRLSVTEAPFAPALPDSSTLPNFP